EPVGLWAEQPLGFLEVGLGFLCAARAVEGPGAEQMRLRQMEHVLGRLQESNRATQRLESGRRLAAKRLESADRPIQPHAGIRILERNCLLDRFVEHRIGAVEEAEIRERIAEVGCKSNVSSDVPLTRRAHFVEALLE